MKNSVLPHVSLLPFSEVSLQDVFFESLRSDYQGFDDWFKGKALKGEKAWVTVSADRSILGFLYLKIEEGAVIDVVPPLAQGRRLKVGTFKINAHGTSLGQLYIKLLLNEAIRNDIKELYVTIFEKHESLVNLLRTYGFLDYGKKPGPKGEELVLIKNLDTHHKDIHLDFPRFDLSGDKYLLSIYPQYHSQMFPDSILRTENPQEIIKDVSHTNSIRKVYISGMKHLPVFKKGDLVVIYRTKDKNQNNRGYSAVATSICTIERVEFLKDYTSQAKFIEDISRYSVFTQEELCNFYQNRKYPYIIKMIFNASLNKRITLPDLIHKCQLPTDGYWGLRRLSEEQFSSIIQHGELNENLIIR